MREKDNQEEFKNLAPKLKYLLDQEQQRAALPKDYFQNFEARLKQRIITEQSLETPVIAAPKHSWSNWWQSVWKPLTALAIPALLLLCWLKASPTSEMPTQTDFLALSTQEIDQYIIQNLEEFSLGELTAMAEPEVLDNWQEGILAKATQEVELKPIETHIAPSSDPTKRESSLDKALEATQNEDLLDELTTEDLNLEEDWF